MPSEFSEEEHIHVLADLIRVIRRWLWFIVAVTIVFVGLAVGFSIVQTPMYEASSKILVAKENRNAANSLTSEVLGLQQLTLIMVELINSRPVAEDVVKDLNLKTTSDDLLQGLSVEQVKATPLIEVTYKDPSPRRAQQVVNAIGDDFAQRVSDDSVVAQDINVSVWEPASLPKDPVSPNFARNISVALVGGVMLGVGLAFLLEHLLWRLKH
jgi:capsular polysaccharide biosynthesis protein